jgi:hypothetical protein
MSIVAALQDSMVGNGERQPIVIKRGEAWDADDPIVVANPSLFTADPGRARSTTGRKPSPTVEQTTRAPGEKSRTRRG